MTRSQRLRIEAERQAAYVLAKRALDASYARERRALYAVDPAGRDPRWYSLDMRYRQALHDARSR